MVKLKAAMLVLPVAFLSLACAHRPPAQASARVPLPPYTANIQIRATAKGRGAVVPAGCAVDPSLGARVELRDGLGGARLLAILKPSSALLFAPDSGESAVWKESDSNLPWSPLDLWTLLSATPPPHRDFARYDSAGRLAACSWQGPNGGRRARFLAGSGAFPYSKAFVDGPMGAILSIEWRSVTLGALPEESLVMPESAMGAGSVAAAQLLERLLP